MDRLERVAERHLQCNYSINETAKNQSKTEKAKLVRSLLLTCRTPVQPAKFRPAAGPRPPAISNNANLCTSALACIFLVHAEPKFEVAKTSVVLLTG